MAYLSLPNANDVLPKMLARFSKSHPSHADHSLLLAHLLLSILNLCNVNRVSAEDSGGLQDRVRNKQAGMVP